MSYIDVYEHELIGLFGPHPVYRPHEEIPGSVDPNDGDFRCLPNQLVLGGGSGEHPGLVLLSPDRAVAEFVIHNPELELSESLESSIFEQYVKGHLAFLFSGWSTRDHHEFYSLCSGPGLPNSFFPDHELGFETWLLLGFGEFIFYAMPELLSTSLRAQISSMDAGPHVLFNNILIVPPRMPIYASAGNAFFKKDN